MGIAGDYSDGLATSARYLTVDTNSHHTGGQHLMHTEFSGLKVFLLLAFLVIAGGFPALMLWLVQ